MKTNILILDSLDDKGTFSVDLEEMIFTVRRSGEVMGVFPVVGYPGAIDTEKLKTIIDVINAERAALHLVLELIDSLDRGGGYNIRFYWRDPA
jgi:hypothetical protein